MIIMKETKKMKHKIWMFVLLALLIVPLSLATAPDGNYPDVNNTGNGSASLVSVYWSNQTGNLSCYIFQSDTSGTDENSTPICWAEGMTSGWSYSNLAVNSTVGQIISWAVYANTTDEEWGTYRGSFEISVSYSPEYRTSYCPISSISSTILYIFIGIFLVGMFLISEMLMQVPFVSLFAGIGILFYSFPLFACNWIYGLIVLAFGLLIMVWSVKWKYS